MEKKLPPKKLLVVFIALFHFKLNYSLDYRYERVYSKFDNYNMAIVGCDGLNNWRIFRLPFWFILFNKIVLD